MCTYQNHYNISIRGFFPRRDIIDTWTEGGLLLTIARIFWLLFFTYSKLKSEIFTLPGKITLTQLLTNCGRGVLIVIKFRMLPFDFFPF